MTDKRFNILIVAGGFPKNFSSASNINKLIRILSLISGNVCVLSPCDEDLIRLPKSDIYTIRTFSNGIEEFAKSQFLELNAMHEIFRKREVDLVFFTFGQDLKLVPVLFAKIMGKKIILRSDGRPSLVYKSYFKEQSAVKRFFFNIIETLCYSTVDLLVSESGYLLKTNYQDTLPQSGIANLPVDTTLFLQKTPIPDRQYDLGYFGQLQKTKGIMNLVESVSSLVKTNRTISVVIGGVGEQKDEIILFIRKNNLEHTIHVIDWIPHDRFPEYLNSVKVFVLPSTLEGLPNSVLEAMASGAVVLSTPVGGIPGVITDGETGFIMENNSVPCITENILRAMNTPDLGRIADNAHALIEREYSCEPTLRRYRELLDKVFKKQEF